MSVSFSASVGPFEGYAVFLRRITVCYQKPVSFVLTPSGDYGHRIRVSRNNLFVPHVSAFTLAPNQEYHLHTALWVEPTDTITAHVDVISPVQNPADRVCVTFAGTLIPYTGDPAIQMAGSNERGVIERLAEAVAAVFRGGAR